MVGGLITAMTLQGCFEEGINAIIEHACGFKSGEFFDGVKETLAQKAKEECEKLIGNDTQIQGRDCETEILDRYSSEEGDSNENLTAECIQELTEKLDNLTNGSIDLGGLASLAGDLTTNFFAEHESELNGMKDGLIDHAMGALEDLKNVSVNPGRLYVVADADSNVGAPRLALGGSLAMLSAGAVAAAAAAVLCRRRRGFQLVGGGEQADGASAQHA